MRQAPCFLSTLKLPETVSAAWSTSPLNSTTALLRAGAAPMIVTTPSFLALPLTGLTFNPLFEGETTIESGPLTPHAWLV